ncbi:flavin reductase family protein [Marinibactrum halimedae]|uniref:Flavin oxidoreductase n=1 Tax=Marinibactrum halimedae TaxID=1444977 RepID=A0AA37T6Y5_9GAMM|nr:flavin reductase family protein [Marinibactrum halimedae]MCD9459516.1 flavin reductase family protein [Marinibactrum halimedae]GLS28170.1 flavin oxidoreductase [Marinibactrum halimedae]
MKEFDLEQSMKEGMRRLASGVCVVSTVEKGGARQAMTASSVTSVSMEPPSLLVCVNRSAAIYSSLMGGQPFSISVLGADQQDVSNRCAGLEDGEARFEIGDWQQCTETGVWYLGDAQSVFVCQRAKDIEFGTHLIMIGEVSRVLVSEAPISSLIYVDGGYL